MKVGNKSELKVDLAKTISVTPSIEVDPKERYYLPYSSIDNSFKETDITIESYDNQTLKSLSATINDKAGDAAAAVIGTAIRLAAISAGLPVSDYRDHVPRQAPLGTVRGTSRGSGEG